jgi:hypothetical protein
MKKPERHSGGGLSKPSPRCKPGPRIPAAAAAFFGSVSHRTFFQWQFRRVCSRGPVTIYGERGHGTLARRKTQGTELDWRHPQRYARLLLMPLP